MNKRIIIVSAFAILMIVLAYIIINRPTSEVTLYVDPDSSPRRGSEFRY